MGEQEAQKVVKQWNDEMKFLARSDLARANEHYKKHPYYKEAEDHAVSLMSESEKATFERLRSKLRVPDQKLRDTDPAYAGAERAVLGELMKDKLIAHKESGGYPRNDYLELSGAWLSMQDGIRQTQAREQRRHHPHF